MEWILRALNENMGSDWPETTQPRCPYCGRFQKHDPDGYYGKLDPEDELSAVEAFCSEEYYDKYQSK